MQLLFASVVAILIGPLTTVKAQHERFIPTTQKNNEKWSVDSFRHYPGAGIPFGKRFLLRSNFDFAIKLSFEDVSLLDTMLTTQERVFLVSTLLSETGNCTERSFCQETPSLNTFPVRKGANCPLFHLSSFYHLATRDQRVLS